MTHTELTHCALAFILHTATAEIFQGNRFSIDSWEYLARFCFVRSMDIPLAGQIQYNVTYEKGAKMNLLFYYAGYQGWDSIYKSSMKCNERLAAGVANRRILMWDNQGSVALPDSCSSPHPTTISDPYPTPYPAPSPTPSPLNVCSWATPPHVHVADNYACSGKQHSDCGFTLSGDVLGAPGLFRKAGIRRRVKILDKILEQGRYYGSYATLVDPSLELKAQGQYDLILDGQPHSRIKILGKYLQSDIRHTEEYILNDRGVYLRPREKIVSSESDELPYGLLNAHRSNGSSHAIHYTGSKWCISKVEDLFNEEQPCLFEVADTAYFPTKIRSQWMQVSNSTSEVNIKLDFDGQAEHLCKCAVQSSGSAGMRTTRSRWFFVALANCDSDCKDMFCQGPIRVQYRFQFTNGDGLFVKHFPADEHGIFEMDICFFLAQLLLLKCSYDIANILQRNKKYHFTVQLLHASVLFQWIGVTCDLIFCAQFARDGIRRNWQGFRSLGHACTGLAQLMVTLLLILLAKGWTIVRHKISASGRVRICLYLSSDITMFFTCLIWADYGFDHIQVKYIFDSPPGYVFIALRCFVCVWFFYASFTTYRNYSEHRVFYQRFLIGFGIWLLMQPLTCAIALAVDDYVRARVVRAFDLALMCAVQTVLLIMYHPRTKCHSFPFHMNSSQMLGLSKGDFDQHSRNDQNSSHAKGPSSSVDGDSALVRAKGVANGMQTHLRQVKSSLESIEDIMADCDYDSNDDFDVDFDGQTSANGQIPHVRQYNPQSFGSDTVNLGHHVNSEQMSDHGRELMTSWQSARRY